MSTNVFKDMYDIINKLAEIEDYQIENTKLKYQLVLQEIIHKVIIKQYNIKLQKYKVRHDLWTDFAEEWLK